MTITRYTTEVSEVLGKALNNNEPEVSIELTEEELTQAYRAYCHHIRHTRARSIDELVKMIAMDITEREIYDKAYKLAKEMIKNGDIT